MKNLVHILLCTIIISNVVSAQESIETQKIILQKNTISLGEIIKAVEQQTTYFVSYNSKQIKPSSEVNFVTNEVTLPELKEILSDQIFAEIEIDSESKKIIILPPKYKIIYGIIRDSSSLETLTGVNVVSRENKGTTTNGDGFFYLKLASQEDSIYISYLGYRTQVLTIPELIENKVIVHLVTDNILPDIIIKANTSIPEPVTSNPKDIQLDNANPIKGIGGRTDLISTLKHISGVSVGSEAQNGYTMRGGGPDQNLVLLDGLPVYEISHLGGLSSIFVDNIIKKADLYKGGLPARFGGKLSSVLDVRLKEGNRHKFKRQVMLNLENFSGFLEGPITKNTSFIFNGRSSILDSYTKPILKKYLDFVDSELKYFDIYSKLTHWFKPSNRLSLSIYSGSDKILLKRSEDSELSFTDSNRVNWSNTLLALNWNAALTNKIFLHAHLGRSDFGFNSESANQTISETLIDTSTLEIKACSDLRDYTIKLNADWYTDDWGIFKLGGGSIFHENSPSIIESESLNREPGCTVDSTYYSIENFLFIESNLRLNDFWRLNTGLRLNSYSGLDTTYNYLQPRFNLQYTSTKWQFNLGYSSMTQFLHLLVNPSSGLPSDLWVPSTKKVAPERSLLSSIGIRHKTGKSFDIGVSGFYSLYSNIIEYTNPSEIIQLIVGNHLEFNRDIRNANWEDRVTAGSGRAYGLELDIAYKRKSFACGISYTLSRSERTFDFGDFSRNDGEETFPYRYDRPHNLAINGELSLTENGKLNFEWLYGDGNAWTLADNVIEGIDGKPIYEFKKRNNQRLSSYQRLSISYSSKKTLKTKGILIYTIGVYNIFNHKNPFYGYLKATTVGQAPKEKEISLYPIFPQLNIGYTW